MKIERAIEILDPAYHGSYTGAEIRFIRGRLKFTDESGQEKDAAPFPSMVVIYRGQRQEDDDR